MSENENRVQRVQALRRSNAATAIPGKRQCDQPWRKNFGRCTCVAWDCVGDERCGFCQTEEEL